MVASRFYPGIWKTYARCGRYKLKTPRVMLKNYLNAAIRILWKHRLFSFIHVTGLAIGLTTGVLVLHYARLEYQQDRFHANYERIYRVATARVRDGIDVTRFATTFAGAGPALQADYPGIEKYTRLYFRSRGGIISWPDGNVRFSEQGIFNVDSGFFNVFSFPLVAGNPTDLLAPGTAFVEEQTARKYFGDQNPIGQRISFGTVEGVEEYEVRGVVRCPAASSIQFKFLFSYHSLGQFFGNEHYTNWSWLDFHTFVKLHPDADPAGLEQRFPDVLRKYRGDRASHSRLILQPLADIYLRSGMEFETGLTGDEGVVRILVVLGIVVLLIVGLNFINLSTAQSLTRAREVGIRKTLGSPRSQLVLQFLTEIGLTNLIAIAVTVCLLWFCLPWFHVLTGKPLAFLPFLQQDLWIYLATFFVGGTLLVGTWPAMHLSAFRPVEVLKGRLQTGSTGSTLRNVFVGFQALVSFSLVAAILIILDQVQFLRGRETGVHTNNILVVPTPSVVNSYDSYYAGLNSFKAELLRDPRVLIVSASADTPGEDVGWVSGARKLGSLPSESTSVYRADIDEDFVPTLELNLLTGQNFHPGMTRHDIMINETALKVLNLEATAAIGHRVLCGADTFTVVGVLKDFHQVSPRESVAATIYHFNLETPRWFMIRFNDNASPVIRQAQQAFERVFPADFFDYYLLDEFYDKQYQVERRLATIMLVFCGLAVLVSALGLLGLTTFTVSRRKKELAIRKIIGSSEIQLYGQAAGSVFMTTLVGCLIGVPLTAWGMSLWLNTFAMHTTIKPWAFAIAGLTSLLVALLAVSGFTLNVIRSNPVNHLRSE